VECIFHLSSPLLGESVDLLPIVRLPVKIGRHEMLIPWQGDFEAAANRLLADEYDEAQKGGDVAGHGGGRNLKVPDGNVETSTSDLGLTDLQRQEHPQCRGNGSRHRGARFRQASACSMDQTPLEPSNVVFLSPFQCLARRRTRPPGALP
jgi:hypothetical protein